MLLKTTANAFSDPKSKPAANRRAGFFRRDPARDWTLRKLNGVQTIGSARGAGSIQMRYRDVDYTVVQGLGQQLWKWGFAIGGKAMTGRAATKAEAVAAAERAIDRALTPRKLRLIRPPENGGEDF